MAQEEATANNTDNLMALQRTTSNFSRTDSTRENQDRAGTPLSDFSGRCETPQSSSSATSGAGVVRTLSKGSRTSSRNSWNGMFQTQKTPDKRIISFGSSGVSVEPQGLNQVNHGRPNVVRTTRFTVLTWLPKSLYGQFQRVANMYFLFVSAIVVFPWSPKSPYSKVIPFVCVLLWTCCKDLFEDTRRRRDDKAVNAQKVKVLERGATHSFKDVTWADVKVGDVVLIPEDNAFPGDMLLLHAAGGMEAFISTVMLDGETSLKDRRAPECCEMIGGKCKQADEEAWTAAQLCSAAEPGEDFSSWDRLENQLTRFTSMLDKARLVFRIAAPTAKLSDVRGTVSCKESAPMPFSEMNFLPRGCHLRNTPWALALVLYAGGDTKTRMNSLQASVIKFSNMQENLNNCVRGLLVALMILCASATIVSYADPGGLAKETDVHPIIKFLKFCITFYHVVPVSLYVLYEMLKLFLGFRVNIDPQMVDDNGQGALARTADLMEEMGQIEFVFSDKTGTLTKNEMVFARCCVAGKDFGDFHTAEREGYQRIRDVLATAFRPEKERDPLFDPVLNFTTALSLCHSVMVTSKRKSQGDTGCKYSGASPDEVALVTAAAKCGIELTARSRKHANTVTEMTVSGPGDNERVFNLLYELPFSSDRKRMSVLVRHHGQVMCVTKGADSVMEGLLREPLTADCQKHLNEFSCAGLRTLIVAMKRVDEEEFAEWQAEWLQTRQMIESNKDDFLAEVAAKIEKNLKFVGITAVEDRLQEGTPEAIDLLKQMGIRCWVLTGDKTETAVDIARSCKLFTQSTVLGYATRATSDKDAEDRLLKAYTELEGAAEGGLVLDGTTLQYALKIKECRKIIYELGTVCKSCICARLSPQQKLLLVQLVREHSKKAITLSIGDGANDVPMIYGAHVGVAVRGVEGAQAVQASDVAISQFRYLVPLLQCHGRRAYRRVALFLCFFLYKNVALIFLDIVWMLQDDFQARIALPEWLSINYNAFFTSVHILPVLGFDHDVTDELANKSPELYKVGPQRALFNSRVFTRWVIFAVYHGVVCWLVPYTFLKPSVEDYKKEETTIFWVSSVSAFTALILTVCTKLIMVSQNPFAMHTILPTLAALFVYFCAVIGLAKIPLGNKMQPCMETLPEDLAGEKLALASIALAPVIALVPDCFFQVCQYLFSPGKLQQVQQKSRK